MKAHSLAIKLTLAWLWVAIPLGWGVCQSAMKSAPLFGIQTTQPEARQPQHAEDVREEPE